MFLFINKMGIHWHFPFAVKTADNRVKLLKYKALKQISQITVSSEHAPAKRP